MSRSVGGSSYYELGNSAYPAVIAANAEVKSQLEDNFYWQAHELTDTGYYVAEGMNFYHGVAGRMTFTFCLRACATGQTAVWNPRWRPIGWPVSLMGYIPWMRSKVRRRAFIRRSSALRFLINN